MELYCPHCSATHIVKNGSVRGTKRWLCRDCGRTFTRLTPRGKPIATKALAVLLYAHGFSLNTTARFVNVTTVTVLRWVREFAREHYAKPVPDGSKVVIEIDEMWHFLKKNNVPSGSGRQCAVLQGDYWTGKLVIVVLPPSND
jgi:transposase-like protein